MNDIKINTDKTLSIILNDKKTKNHTLKICGERIQDLPLGASTRYLGIYLRTTGIKALTINIISNEINYITKSISTKAITNKQAHYIIYSILYPIIEYCSQTIYIPK